MITHQVDEKRNTLAQCVANRNIGCLLAMEMSWLAISPQILAMLEAVASSSASLPPL